MISLVFMYCFFLFVVIAIGIFTYLAKNDKLKIILIAVDGNIGAGKSTLLKNLSAYIKLHNIQNISIVPEPVEDWEETGILKSFYLDKKKYAGGFQYFVLNTLINALRSEINKYKHYGTHIIITERSLESTRWVFAKMLYDDQFIDQVEMNCYLKLYNNIDSIYFPSATIFLDVDPTICYERIAIRDRDGESAIGLDYLEKCNEYYHNMVASISGKVLKLNNYENHINQIVDFISKQI